MAQSREFLTKGERQMLDDPDIVALYHKRDERAITESDAKYGSLCRSIALRLLGHREDAEECVNDTWFSAWNAMPPERPAFLGAFLGRITRNHAISRWRRDHAQKRFDGMEILLSELNDCVPGADTAQLNLERRELAGWISAWLDQTQAGDRWLFLRRYWYGEPVEELAAQLGIRPNTCSQRLLRLRKSLRTFLEARAQET